MTMSLRLYTDGACSRNGQEGAIGGWAFVIVDSEDNIIDSGNGRAENTTNQQMELTAIIEGLSALVKLSFFTAEIFSDSAYCINAINDGWINRWLRNGWLTSKKEPVKNQGYWEALYALYSVDDRLTFTKVKGHSTDKWNNYVDAMAVNSKDRKYDF